MMSSISPATRDFIASLPADVKAKLALRYAQQRARGAAGTAVTPDIDVWIDQSLTIEEPQGDRVSIIPFRLWPRQVEALDMIKTIPQLIVLKARQLGMTWLVLAYALWLCIFHDNKLVMVFSKDQESANEMIRRVRGMFQRITTKPVDMPIDNVTTLGWSNGSRIKAFAATEDAGSSFTASLTIIDEFAKMRYADSLYTAVKPTIADGGRMIIISTAKGESNPFHKLWDAAVKALNSFTPLFLDWRARPDRTEAWYARQATDALSMAHHQQEYPATPEEAFVNIADEPFLSSMLLWDACEETLPVLDSHMPIVLALDAAISGDSFGLLGVSEHPTRAGCYAVRIVKEWKPPEKGVIDYYGDADQPGPDWFIRNTLVKNYAISQAAYDPYQLHALCSKLTTDRVLDCVPFNQGADRLEADKNLWDIIMAKRIVHDGNLSLRAHISNADRKLDPESRKLRIVKREQRLKIDLAVCLSMALITLIKSGGGTPLAVESADRPQVHAARPKSSWLRGK